MSISSTVVAQLLWYPSSRSPGPSSEIGVWQARVDVIGDGSGGNITVQVDLPRSGVDYGYSVEKVYMFNNDSVARTFQFFTTPSMPAISGSPITVSLITGSTVVNGTVARGGSLNNYANTRFSPGRPEDPDPASVFGSTPNVNLIVFEFGFYGYLFPSRFSMRPPGT